MGGLDVFVMEVRLRAVVLPGLVGELFRICFFGILENLIKRKESSCAFFFVCVATNQKC